MCAALYMWRKYVCKNKFFSPDYQIQKNKEKNGNDEEIHSGYFVNF